MPPAKDMSSCLHKLLTFTSHGPSKYKRPSDDQILGAIQVSGPSQKKRKGQNKQSGGIEVTAGGSRSTMWLPSSATFPAPLALRGDELDCDPEYAPQALQDWMDEDSRNDVTARRRTIYVVPPPSIGEDAAFLNEWAAPGLKRGMRGYLKEREWTPPPSTEDVVEYLEAFYHSLPVKILSKPALEFIRWETEIKSKAAAKSSTSSEECEYIGLSTQTEAIRIRSRPSGDTLFSGQLNLNDLLDVAISILPSDAYALLMLVNHDLYESDDDDFCCGRAYGGSRVAVVSTARYRPELDKKQKQTPPEHAWPASHCLKYAHPLSLEIVGPTPRLGHRPKDTATLYPDSAVVAAVAASTPLLFPTSPAELSTLWLGRVCKTASHELGHCFGIDHCMYYACVMQGTASLAEDSRQPPYLCPVDLAKVLRATGANEKERYRALLEVCERWKNDRMFAAFGAWTRTRLDEQNVVSL